jgi:nucleotidyltransferase AbiEii toxin of type IV toxin-antitoxin system
MNEGDEAVTPGPVYQSPQAMRRAVTDRLRAEATPNGRWSLNELQRQYAYERLLARLYTVDPGWVIKGAVALLARQVSSRHSMDIDIYRDEDPGLVERKLREAGELDLGDWFRFEIGLGEPLTGTTGGARFSVVAWIGATKWAEFHVDMVGTGVVMTGEPDEVPAVTGIEIPGIAPIKYRAYPLVDHIADKVGAILERHGDGRPSTRFRDLVDLTSLVTRVEVRAEDQRVAVLSELDRRKVVIPEHFDVPDQRLWEVGFAAAIRKAAEPTVNNLAEALALMRAFLDPVLDGTATGQWDPAARRWQD